MFVTMNGTTTMVRHLIHNWPGKSKYCLRMAMLDALLSFVQLLRPTPMRIPRPAQIKINSEVGTCWSPRRAQPWHGIATGTYTIQALSVQAMWALLDPRWKNPERERTRTKYQLDTLSSLLRSEVSRFCRYNIIVIDDK